MSEKQPSLDLGCLPQLVFTAAIVMTILLGGILLEVEKIRRHFVPDPIPIEKESSK